MEDIEQLDDWRRYSENEEIGPFQRFRLKMNLSDFVENYSFEERCSVPD
jgi:hypothetical protein